MRRFHLVRTARAFSSRKAAQTWAKDWIAKGMTTATHFRVYRSAHSYRETYWVGLYTRD